MKAAAFAYARATSVANALELRAVHGEKARVLSGGQGPIPPMNLRLVAPDVIVELAELRGIAVKGETRVIGAPTRHADLLKSSDIVKCAAARGGRGARRGPRNSPDTAGHPDGLGANLTRDDAGKTKYDHAKQQ